MEIDKLTSKQLFQLQYEAHKRKDWEMVKKIALLAKQRNSFTKTSTRSWEEAKDAVERLPDPSPQDLAGAIKNPTPGRSHDGHSMDAFVIRKVLFNYPLEFNWGYCNKCSELRYKYWLLIDHKNRRVYQREIVNHGKQIENISEFAESLFSSVTSAPRLDSPKSESGLGALVIPGSPS